ncbi:MAG TPA: hypothetical protein IAA15_05780 [Candidatus Olsenella pullicola]|nr:hypothetical protein [Candidatus Olsenella pullicola]
MTYLIMECAAGYAVALDENGRFLKVPNLGYEVGQRVDDVVVFEGGPYGEAEVLPFGEYRARRTRGRRLALVAAAACLVMAVVSGAVVWRLPVGTVYMAINPEVSMEVNRLDRVVSLEGENEDGEALVEGFGYYGRTVDEVSDDLADRAEEQGYLEDGGTIELSVESDDEEWKVATEDRLVVELEVHLEHRIIVVAVGDSGGSEEPPAQSVSGPSTQSGQELEIEPAPEPESASEPRPEAAAEPAAPPAASGGEREPDDDWDDDDSDDDSDDGDSDDDDDDDDRDDDDSDDDSDDD